MLAICSCAILTPDPTVALATEPTSFPTNLPFEPQITMPPRATRALQPPPPTFGPEGPLYYDALRAAVGDDAFFQILRTYYAENRFGIATPDCWLSAVEKVTGDRHMDLYTKWVAGGG